MEVEFDTMVVIDTVPLESPIAESRLLNLDSNTDILDGCESARRLGYGLEDSCEEQVVLDSEDEGGDRNGSVGVEDYCVKRVVLDSDDEGGGDQNEVVVSGCFSGNMKLSSMGEIGSQRRRQVRKGYFRRLDKKFRKRVFLHIDSASNDVGDEESNIGRTCLYSKNKFLEHLGVMDNVLSTSADERPVPTNTKEVLFDTHCQNSANKCSVEDSHDERKSSSHDSNPTNTGGEANERTQFSESEDKALGFVDHYLSVSDLGSYKDMKTIQTKRLISPPSLRSKGSQCLARRVDLARNASNFMTFDWTETHTDTDEYTTLEKNVDPVFGFGGKKSKCLSSFQEPDNFNLRNETLGLHLEEKLAGNLASTDDSNTNLLDSSDIVKVGSNSGFSTAYDSAEFGKQFDVGPLRQNTKGGDFPGLTPEMLDIGLDTQIAAEAMGELILAAPPIFDPCLAFQVSESTSSDSYPVTEKGRQKNVANHEDAFVGWRCKKKRSRCIMISTVGNKDVTCSAVKRSEKQRGLVDLLPVNMNIVPENSKCEEPIRVPMKESPRIHLVYKRRSKETADQLKSDSPVKRMKMDRFHDDVCKIGIKDSYSRVKTERSKSEENIDLYAADCTLSLSKLNPWIYPKGKRSRPLNVSNHCSPFSTVKNNAEKYPTVHDGTQKRVATLFVYRRRRRVSLEQEHIGTAIEVAGNLSPLVNHDAYTEKQGQIPIELDTTSPAKQHTNFDDAKCSFVNASSVMKSLVLPSNMHSPLQVLDGSEKCKRQLNHLSKSPIMKELSRLGYPESLPDFMPKDLRRRRATKTVCILFSQNLETSVLKQQKKIMARLGFLVASSCSDATHFVTDRFVRTKNMLEAIALGRHVVTHLWLEACEQAGYVVDERSYVLRDGKKEKEIGFNMLVSLSRAKQHPLLKGRRVFITPNVKPDVDAVSGLVEAVGGQVVQSITNPRVKDKLIPEDLLVISCEEDHTTCLPFLEEEVSVYSSELLLNGIVTQKLEYRSYQLFEDFAKRNTGSR
ncbi:BRCT domain-containing DNA repair protein [Striga hermonthica]|uniref:BRCT domain-containing DNA repair protein n=1 Tax=Striga hermonthica TaxID=68872 RepID=A0A9N7RL48_STRHE|nr:BRCT domain-containing DNA repair protein [Striga hermonthica]